MSNVTFYERTPKANQTSTYRGKAMSVICVFLVSIWIASYNDSGFMNPFFLSLEPIGVSKHVASDGTVRYEATLRLTAGASCTRLGFFDDEEEAARAVDK